MQFNKIVILNILLIIFLISMPNVAWSSSVPSKIIINKQAKSRSYTNMPAPVFDHRFHENLIKCSACHPKLFIKKIGANNINMKENMEGNYCGKCHDAIIAFGMAKCDVCHKER